MNRWGIRLYNGILLLYPATLRREYGREMAEIFADDLATAWHKRSIRGVIQVVWQTTTEIFRIALPERLVNPAMVAPAVSIGLHLAVVLSVLALAAIARDGIPHNIGHGFIMLRRQ